MITARLNKLIRAYRIAKQQLGDANRGRAILSICLRRLNRLRPIVLAELKYVAALVNLMRRGLLKRKAEWMRFPTQNPQNRSQIIPSHPNQETAA
tara:strand:+ start:13584 stop:13868 length:285 start_codon:yes stop_codon:yes gene_type:complete